jgi:hypothetical protein
MTTQENTVPFTKTAPPEWLLAFWKEIDDKTFGKGFDCFTEDAVCNLGVADWHGREAIRKNLKAFIDTGFTAHHDVVEYWDGRFWVSPEDPDNTRFWQPSAYSNMRSMTITVSLEPKAVFLYTEETAVSI